MTDSNRTQLAFVREATLGVTPNTPRMRNVEFTGEGLSYKPQFVQSETIRADRMNSDPIKVGEENQGPINGELIYPTDNLFLSDALRSLLFRAWTLTPQRDNDGTADSVITNVANSTDVLTVTTGAAFVVGHLVRFTGFAQAANNGLFRCTTGSATVPAFVGANFALEAAPPAAARVKVVGFQGASADITALADGLGSTALDFTTLNLSIGQWIKIGGTGAAFQFATAACNGWARITAITATKLTLDNLPVGWTTDSGTGKTIRVFFGDFVKNGVDMTSLTLERGFLAQASPTYIAQAGMVNGQGEFTFETEQIVKYAFTFMGMSGSQSTTPLDASPDAAPTGAALASNVNVGRIAESGVAVGSPNWVKSATLTINNNLRMKTAIGAVGAVDIGAGECSVSGTLQTYFGSNALLTKLMAGTVGNLNLRAAKNSQAVIFGLPRVTFTDGAPNAPGKNQDVFLPLNFMASRDATTDAQVIIDRLEYYE